METSLFEAWRRLTADALQGSGRARGALGALGEMPLSPLALGRWAETWMPDAQGGSSGGASLQDLGNLVEDWWASLGVVPRRRYAELLDKHEELRERLREAERTVGELRRLATQRGQEQAMSETLERWEGLVRQSLEAQGEWAKSWTDGLFGHTSGSPSTEKT